MKRNLLFLYIFIFIFFMTMNLNVEAQYSTWQTALPEEGAETAESPALGEEVRISLSLRNIDIIDALKFFSMKSGLNIIPTQRVSGRVTLAVQDAPIKDVFDIMLRSNNLAYDKKNNIYNVMTEEEYRKLYGRDFSDTRVVKVFRLKYAIPEQAFSLLDALKSEIGRLLIDVESGAVMIIDTPERIAEAQNALQALEQKSSIRVFNLQYAKAKDVEGQLKTQLDLKKVGSVRADDRTNQLIVQTLPERMKDIETLIKSLDKKTKAVLIDTKIIKIKLSNQMDTGIQWEGLFNLAKEFGMTYLGSYPFSAVQATTASWRSREQVLSDLGGSVGSYPFSGTTTTYNTSAKVTPGEKMHVGIIGKNRDFDVIINYLQTLGKTKILSNPSLAVVNNEEARIHIGERRAYVTTTTTTGATTETVSEEVTYVEIGVRLSITPMINEEGYVTMKVRPEISSVVGNVTTSSGNLIPIIDTSTAETTVIAKDGATIMLGGLGREEKTEGSEQVPILGKIPILGFFFRSKTQKTERTELVIMLTPIIFEGDKLVIPKDKETERFGPKPVKRFDVFRPEIPIQETSAGLAPAKEEFVTKDFKSYETIDDREDIQIQRVPLDSLPPKEETMPKGINSDDLRSGLRQELITEQAPKVSPPLKEREELFIFKGFRSYN